MGNNNEKYHHARSRGGHWITGLVLIGIGTVFLLERLAYIDIGAWTHYWPFILAAVGVGRMVDARSAAQLAKGGFMVFLAFWLYACLEHVWGLSFRTGWPLLLIALGLEYMVAGLAKRSQDSSEKAPS